MAPKLSYITSPCMWCVRAVKWLPVILIVAIVVWSYYAYVIQLNLIKIDGYIKKGIYLFLYHILLTMFLWAYWQTIFTDIGRVPKQFRLPPADLERYLNAETEDARRETLDHFCQRQLLPVINRTITGDIRYCDKCHHVKPDRCHHCSMCSDCVLKMDHHCPWVNNCVGFSNYKFFVLFLGYSLIYCLFIAATTLEFFIKCWTSHGDDGAGKFHIIFLFFVSIMFAISLVSLFGYHIYLVTKNRSTLESFRAPIFRLRHSWTNDKEGFSLGAYNNFVEIFGDDRSKWFLPVFTSVGDGVTFPLKTQLASCTTSSSSQPSSPPPGQSYGSTNTSLGDGVSYPQRLIDEDTDGLLESRQRWADDDEPNGRFNGAIQPELEEVMVQSNHTNPL